MADGHHIFVDVREYDKVKGRGAGSVLTDLQIEGIVRTSLQLHLSNRNAIPAALSTNDAAVVVKDSSRFSSENKACEAIIGNLKTPWTINYFPKGGEIGIRFDKKQIVYAASPSIGKAFAKLILQAERQISPAVAWKSVEVRSSLGYVCAASKQNNKLSSNTYEETVSSPIEAEYNNAKNKMLWVFPPPQNEPYNEVFCNRNKFFNIFSAQIKRFVLGFNPRSFDFKYLRILYAFAVLPGIG